MYSKVWSHSIISYLQIFDVNNQGVTKLTDNLNNLVILKFRAS